MKLNTLFENFSKQIYSKPNESSDEDSALAAASTKRLTEWENEKYRMLLDDSIEWKGHTLYRIQYKKKIDITINNNIFCRAYKDDLGGYIENLDNLSEKGECVVSGDAKVWGNAKVYGDAKIEDNAQIYDNAQVYGHGRVWANAQIYDNAQVWANAQIYDNAQVYGDAKVHGLSNNGLYNKWICVYGKSEIYGDADVCNNDDMDMKIKNKKINH